MLSTSEETLFKEFSHFKRGSVERVKKFTDYAFVHYHCREDALVALEVMNGVLIDGAAVEVMLAKPASGKDDGSGGGSRRHGSRGHLRNSSAAAGGKWWMYRGDGGAVGTAPDDDAALRTMAAPSCAGSLVFAAAAGERVVAMLTERFRGRLRKKQRSKRADKLRSCVSRRQRWAVFPPVPRHAPHPHQRPGPEAEPVRHRGQPAGHLLPPEQLVGARVPAVLHAGP